MNSKNILFIYFVFFTLFTCILWHGLMSSFNSFSTEQITGPTVKHVHEEYNCFLYNFYGSYEQHSCYKNYLYLNNDTYLYTEVNTKEKQLLYLKNKRINEIISLNCNTETKQCTEYNLLLHNKYSKLCGTPVMLCLLAITALITLIILLVLCDCTS